jgi:hypothetical protein
MVLNIGMLQHSPLRDIQGMGNFVYSFEGSIQVSKSSTYISIVFDPITFSLQIYTLHNVVHSQGIWGIIVIK